jgi:DNA-binding Xre family transcriptional regulator
MGAAIAGLGLDIQIFAKRLGEMREARRLSQTALAEQCGMNLGNLNELERAKASGVRGDTVVRLCRILGCSADYLLGLADNPRPRRAPVALCGGT